MTQDELVSKFRQNAKRVLTQEKIEHAVESFLKLEDIPDIAQVIREVTL